RTRPTCQRAKGMRVMVSEMVGVAVGLVAVAVVFRVARFALGLVVIGLVVWALTGHGTVAGQ
ncbi:MAG: hypothetical protein J2P17_23465, partial [Mycobacterium sp.]|nr:hypothetical protein [Mycobacterium sp.]